jgi:hypothetical protein
MITARHVSGLERIRGPSLAVFVKCKEGVTPEKALSMAEGEGGFFRSSFVIASNKTLDRALAGKEWQKLLDILPCWSGTMTAYVKPGKKLNKFVECVVSRTGHTYVFPVPQEHQGKKNSILVAEHPDYFLEADGKYRVVQATATSLIERFPAEGGFYLPDAEHGIPCGGKADYSNPFARILWRDEKRVGLVSRGEHYPLDRVGAQIVGLNASAICTFGVAIESPDGGVPLVGENRLTFREENGSLVVSGPPGQIAAVARLLESLK